MRLALSYQHVDPSKGGAETYVVDLCRRLADLGHEVDLHANAWREGTLPAGVRPVFVPVSGSAKTAKLLSFAESALRSLANREYDCTVGFINTWGTDVLIPQGGVHDASLEANARRFPAGWRRELYLLGKRLNPKRGLYREIEARQYDPASTTRYVAVSRMVRGHLQRFHGVPESRTHVIPNAIDAGRLAVDDPAAARSAFRASLDLGPDDLVALFVGHNYRLKGLKPLIEALAARKSGRPIHLLACGGGDPAPFRRMVARLGLGSTVRLLGFLPDVRPAFHAADFFVSPTYYDPCSLVVFEALACGLPVITTRCNGAGEVMTEGREGFVVEHPDASDQLVAALDAMTDDADRRRMAEAAHRLGREQSFDRHVDRLLDVFREVARLRAASANHSHAA